MNNEDIVRMAREAGETLDKEWLQRFAALVRADEREACAKVCEKEMEPYSGFDKESYAGGAALTAAAVSIRARGQS